MNVTDFNDAQAYFPPGHVDMRCYRLQGGESEPASSILLNLCLFLPGGSTGTSASPSEKIYLVLEGELVVISDGQEEVLGVWDSCRIPPGATRLIENRTRRPASIMLLMSDSCAAQTPGNESSKGHREPTPPSSG